MKQSASRLDFRGQFLNYKANGYTATLLGKEQLNGKDNYKIKLSKSGEVDLVFYIDATNYYINKLVTAVKANGSDLTSETVFSDYKKTPDGFVFPYTTTITSGAAPGEIKSVITKLVPNQTIDPKIFQKP